jgi:hypothetical protein
MPFDPWVLTILVMAFCVNQFISSALVRLVLVQTFLNFSPQRDEQ